MCESGFFTKNPGMYLMTNAFNHTFIRKFREIFFSDLQNISLNN